MTTDEAIFGMECWRDGYQTAVDSMRVWANEFADEQAKVAILTCAAMIEASKPEADPITEEEASKLEADQITEEEAARGENSPHHSSS